MKTLTAIILLIATTTQAQFSLSTSAGYGISVNSNLEYTLFQSVITITPKYKFNNLIIGVQSNAVNSDSATTMFNGLNASYIAKQFGPDKSLSLSAHFLLGFEGDMLTGAGLSYDWKQVGFDLSVSQEYNRRELWVIGGIRFAVIPF